MIKAVIYARYSSHNQQEQSIDGQMRACFEYAKRNGYEIIDKYIDRAKTGTNSNRPAFQQMLRDSTNGIFQAVLVYQFDRFSRNRRESINNEFYLYKNGIKLISVTEAINQDDTTSVIVKGMYECIAEYYSKDLSKKVKRGLHESIIARKTIGGIYLFGYKSDSKKQIVTIPEEAELVKDFYKKRASGLTIDEIVSFANQTGFANHGQPFNSLSIRKILSNEKYIGIYQNPYNRLEILNDYYPRIIDDNLYDIVQKTFDSYKLKPKNQKLLKGDSLRYLLTGKLFSGYTGKPLVGTAGTSATGKVYRYYFDKKSSIKVSKEKIEDQIIEAIKSLLKDDDVLNYLVEKIKVNISTNNNNSSLQELKTSEKAIAKKLEKIRESFVDAPEHSSVRNDLVSDYENQSNKLLLIRKEIKRAESYNSNIINYVGNIKNYVSKKITNINSDDDKKRFVNVFLCTAFVESDIVYIYLNLDNEEIVSFDEYKTDLKDLESNRSVRIKSRLAE